MKVDRFDSVMIWSENWKELGEWYAKTFDLEKTEELNLSNDTGMVLKVGDGSIVFWIGYHDQVKGTAKDPYRIMIGLHVDDVYKAYDELSKKGVEFIAKPQISPTNDYDVATAKDPDGNIIQLIHIHEQH